MKLSGFSIMLAAVTIDMLDSPVRRLWQPRCREVRLVEHPVSIVILAPRKSKKCEVLLDTMAEPFPVNIVLGIVSGSRVRLSL